MATARSMQEQVGDYSRWMCLYPCYLDSNKRVSEGRRISKADGCPGPHPMEMLEVCKYLKLAALVEPKSHPRNPKWENGPSMSRAYTRSNNNNKYRPYAQR